MTVHLSGELETALRQLAGLRGEKSDSLVDEAIQQYIDAAGITDVTSADVGVTQEALLGELRNAPSWSDGKEPDGHEAG